MPSPDLELFGPTELGVIHGLSICDGTKRGTFDLPKDLSTRFVIEDERTSKAADSLSLNEVVREAVECLGEADGVLAMEDGGKTKLT